MPKIEIDYSLGVKSLPDSSSLLIVGNIKHLQTLKYNDIKVKLQPFVTEEVRINSIFDCFNMLVVI